MYVNQQSKNKLKPIFLRQKNVYSLEGLRGSQEQASMELRLPFFEVKSSSLREAFRAGLPNASSLESLSVKQTFKILQQPKLVVITGGFTRHLRTSQKLQRRRGNGYKDGHFQPFKVEPHQQAN